MMETESMVEMAVKLGYRHIDTAAVYRNEDQVGRAIKKLIKNKIVGREELFITTKIPPKDQGYEKAKKAIQKSLDTLQLDYIDLMLVHWPGTERLKPTNPKNKLNRIETMQAMNEYYQMGKIKAVGVSNFNKEHFDGIPGEIHFNQIEFHPLQSTSEITALTQYCKNRGIVMGAYSCLGEGSLLDPETYPELGSVAGQTGVSIAQVLIAWALAKGCVVMPKASSETRLRENMNAGKVVLSDDQILEIDGIIKRVGPRKFCWDPVNVV